MRNKITKTSLTLVLMLIAAFLFANSVFAQRVSVKINVTINGASGEDYVEYLLRGQHEREIKTSSSVTVLSGREVKLIAHGSFLNWTGTTCGEGSGNVLEFEATGDCNVIANFGVATRRR